MAKSFHTLTVFTTGQAAKICHVSQQTIIRCFDNGSLKGFRVPGSKFRRIPRDNLIRFMKENGIPMDALGPLKRYLAVIDIDASRHIQLADILKTSAVLNLLAPMATLMELGMVLRETPPYCVVLCSAALGEGLGSSISLLRSRPELEKCLIVVLTGGNDPSTDKLLAAGVNKCMPQSPFNPQELVQWIMDR